MGQPDFNQAVCAASKSSLLEVHRDIENREKSFISDENGMITKLEWECKDIGAFPSVEVKALGDRLTYINLNNNSITKLPNGLSVELPHLQVFCANGNKLCSLPEDIGELKQLQELYLCDNDLTSLPESLCQLTCLRILKASTNFLTRLHKEIGQNTSLLELNVNENQLRRFPATIGLLTNLVVLEAKGNKLEAIPRTLNFLKNLRTIDLSENSLTHLPESFGELAGLRQVDLSQNKIHSLCNHFESTVTLERLYLDFNHIISLPKWFCDLVNITEISLKSNRLAESALPAGFGVRAKHLKRLDLRENYIEKLPESFGYLQLLETLLCGTTQPLVLESIGFQNGNWLSSLPQNFSDLISLSELCLQDNRLKELPEDFGRLIHLVKLFLGGNFLSELPTSFTSLRSLQQCRLSRNRIKKLPEDFGALTCLEELYLDSNKLKALPVSMKQLTKLEVLDLTENKLRHTPLDILACMSNLKALNMFSNKFEVPELKIPHIAKRNHCVERNPLCKDNLTVKSNASEAEDLCSQELEKTSLPLLYEGEAFLYSHEEDEEEEEEDSHCLLVESSDDENWDNEAELSESSASICQHSALADEENWGDETETDATVCATADSDFTAGQFDLDDDMCPPQKSTRRSPVTFDFYGNSSQPLYLTITQHRMMPHLLHTPQVSRALYDGGCVVEGQFDSDEDTQDGVPVVTEKIQQSASEMLLNTQDRAESRDEGKQEHVFTGQFEDEDDVDVPAESLQNSSSHVKKLCLSDSSCVANCSGCIDKSDSPIHSQDPDLCLST